MGTPKSLTDRGFVPIATIGAGVWILLDILRVWLSSLVIVFGQEGTTPLQNVGLFVLVWFLAPLPILLLRFLVTQKTVERSAQLPVDVWFAVLLVGARLGLQGLSGEQLQLYVSSLGLAVGLTWLATIVVRMRRSLLRGFAAGIALATLTHTALGTYAVVWRSEVLGWVLTAVQLLLFAWVLARTSRVSRDDFVKQAADSVLCFLLPPALLVAVTVTAAPARAEAATGWPDGWAAALVMMAVALAAVVAGASSTPGSTPLLSGAVLVIAVGAAIFPTTTDEGVPGLLPFYAPIAQAVGAIALIAALSWADWPGARGRPPRANNASLAVFFGSLVFYAVLLGIYAGYTLGYPTDALVVGVALLIAVAAVVHGRAKDRDSGSRVRRSVFYRWPGATLAASAGIVAAILPQVVPLYATTDPFSDTTRTPAVNELRVVAYNIRMGYGLTGTYDIEGIAETIQRAQPDVVLLNEVDRGWFLTGGQDTLGTLARMLDMQAVFAPSNGQLWGDAVLTRLPIVETVGYPLRGYGSTTGAQALAVVVKYETTEIEVIATHLQSPGTEEGEEPKEPTLQAADLADIIIKRRSAHGRPVIVGGDFNFERNGAAWREMERAGLYDALFRVRPSPTFPADDPDEELDHIFATAGLVREQGAVLPASYSDHVAVMAVLRLESPLVYGT